MTNDTLLQKVYSNIKGTAGRLFNQGSQFMQQPTVQRITQAALPQFQGAKVAGNIIGGEINRAKGIAQQYVHGPQNLPEYAARYLNPNTVQLGQETLQDIGSGKGIPAVTRQEVLANLGGPVGIELFGTHRQKLSSRAGGELLGDYQLARMGGRIGSELADKIGQAYSGIPNKEAGFIKTGQPENNWAKKIEAEQGWKPGMKAKFDQALLDKDAKQIKQMLPDVPPEYRQRMEWKINNITGNTTVAYEDTPFLTPDGKLTPGSKPHLDVAAKELGVKPSMQNQQEIMQTYLKQTGNIRIANTPSQLNLELSTSVDDLSKAQLDRISEIAGGKPVYIDSPQGAYSFKNGADFLKAAQPPLYDVSKLPQETQQIMNKIKQQSPNIDESSMMKYAQKIAELDNSKIIKPQHLAEAYQYTTPVENTINAERLFSRGGLEIQQRAKEVGVSGVDEKMFTMVDKIRNQSSKLDTDGKRLIELYAKQKLSGENLNINDLTKLSNILDNAGKKPTIKSLVNAMQEPLSPPLSQSTGGVGGIIAGGVLTQNVSQPQENGITPDLSDKPKLKYIGENLKLLLNPQTRDKYLRAADNTPEGRLFLSRTLPFLKVARKRYMEAEIKESVDNLNYAYGLAIKSVKTEVEKERLRKELETNKAGIRKEKEADYGYTSTPLPEYYKNYYKGGLDIMGLGLKKIGKTYQNNARQEIQRYTSFIDKIKGLAQ
jgi:hypothetical protein